MAILNPGFNGLCRSEAALILPAVKPMVSSLPRLLPDIIGESTAPLKLSSVNYTEQNVRVSRTSTINAPWTLVQGNDKRFSRVKILEAICERLADSLKKK